MEKLLKIGVYFLILNLLFGNSQIKEVRAFETLKNPRIFEQLLSEDYSKWKKEKNNVSPNLVSEKRGRRVLGSAYSLRSDLTGGMLDSNGNINVFKDGNLTATAGVSRQKGESEAVYYSNNEDITKGKTIYNNNPEVKVIGVDVKTKEIEGSVKSLDIISVQDSVNSSSRGYSISYGIGIGEHSVVRNGRKENANGLYTQNMGIGYSKGELTQRTTNAVGSFIAESGILNVEGKTRQVGSVIDGGFTLNTKEYEYEDLEDINKSRNIGINLTITPGVVEIYKNGMLTGNAKGGTAYGTRISFNEKDYVAKAKATIGSNVKTIIDGKEEELKEVNRDIGNRIEVIRNKEISPINIDLGTEYWGTDYAREKVKGDFVKAGNKIERVSEIIKGIMENENKDIVLYYKDRIDFEEERDRLERSGELETTLIDKEKAKEIAKRASGEKIEDLQIISSKDPNIKDIVGANAIRGRAYHRSGKIIIVADNIEDYAKAIGVIAKEGRHFYHRRENGMEDTEDLSTFYGRQFERYNRKKFEDKDANFVTEQLRYTREQLGNDWENDVISIHGGARATAKNVDGPRKKYKENGLLKNEIKKELDFNYNVGIQLYTDEGVKVISKYRHRENSTVIDWAHSLGADSTLEAYAMGYKEKIDKIDYSKEYPRRYSQETGKIIRPQRADELNIVMPRINFIEKYLDEASKNAVKINLYVLKNDKGLSAVKDYGDRSYETLQKKIKDKKISVPKNVKIIPLDPIYKNKVRPYPDYTIKNHAPALDYGNPMFEKIWENYEKSGSLYAK